MITNLKLDTSIPPLSTLLAQTAALHDHLCPRQVLGVRMGMYAAQLFGLDLPQSDKRVFTFIETDGCFADGVSVATGCWLGRRTMRLVDYGKVATTFVDTHTGTAIRISPCQAARDRAVLYSPSAPDPWHAQLEAYKIMPTTELLLAQSVTLIPSLEAIISKPGLRVPCALCGEDIMNRREALQDGQSLCLPCAGISSYYTDE